jgi:hypothetical protein
VTPERQQFIASELARSDLTEERRQEYYAELKALSDRLRQRAQERRELEACKRIR